MLLAKNPPSLETNSIEFALCHAESILSEQSETSTLDAQVLLAHITGQPRAWLLAHPEAPLTDAQSELLTDCLKRLMSGDPLPYVTGKWEFYGLPFIVTPDVLIPRPETELLVETALAWLTAHPDKCRVADVGTGCGCIALSIAARQPNVHIIASDISKAACLIAMRNLIRHRLYGKVVIVLDDLVSVERGPFDLLCANLPYIPSDTLASLEVYGREPTLALDGGQDGLALIQRLLGRAPQLVVPGGLILLEIEAGQGSTAHALARNIFPNAHIQILSDLAGCDRLLMIQT